MAREATCPGGPLAPSAAYRATRRARPGWRAAHLPRAAAAALALGMTLAIVASFAASVTAWTPASWVAVVLVAMTAVWISGGAATALLGLVTPAPRWTRAPLPSGPPASRTALLVTLCGEDPAPLAHHLAALRAGLDRAGLGDATEIFVLSDTRGDAAVARETAALGPLHDAGLLRYRRRAVNTGRKPGNIADWVTTQGAEFAHMLVLDADSRMTPGRIRRMILQMERSPDLGLLQAGIALLPGRTRFGHHQRTAARLLSRGFGRGLAAWTGPCGNYWGHNAIIRIAAFRAALALPVLPGEAPWGGDVLSHDFVEAAWIRRAGWAVALDPETRGSAEDAPQTLGEFHTRDRRWCQGNLQHLRLIAAPGLDPVSRLHLAMGVLGYLVAPAWLALIVLIALGAVPLSGIAPLAVVAGVLLLPKLCALLSRWRAARTARRRALVLRASLGELVVSSLVAPLVMLRQAGAVLSVCLGRDCGWRPGAATRRAPRAGRPEALAGGALLALAALASGPGALWLAPVVLPLCAAPLVIRAMDAPG